MPEFNPTNYYVDPSIGTDTGIGTLGDPFGNLNHAFQTASPDTTSGTRFYVKGGATDVVPVGGYQIGSHNGNQAYTVIEGYTTTPGDGGKCTIQSSDNSRVFGNGASVRPNNFIVRNVDYDLNNQGGAAVLYLGNESRIENCTEINSVNRSYTAFAALGDSRVFACHAANLSTASIANSGCQNCLAETGAFGVTANDLVDNCVSIEGSGYNFRSAQFAKGCISISKNSDPAASHFRPTNSDGASSGNCIIIGGGVSDVAFNFYRCRGYVVKDCLYFNVGTFAEDGDPSGIPSSWALENNTLMDADPFEDSANLDLRLTTAAQAKPYAERLIKIMLGQLDTPGITMNTEAELLGMLGGGGGSSVYNPFNMPSGSPFASY